MKINVRIFVMKIIYTKHAEGKLKRADIKSFKIDKKFIEAALSKSEHRGKTKYNDFSHLSSVSEKHDLRIIYDIIDSNIKVITFHIARKGRYDKA